MTFCGLIVPKDGKQENIPFTLFQLLTYFHFLTSDMNVGEGGPDVWYITRTWLIIGDGLHQGGCLMMMSASGGRR